MSNNIVMAFSSRNIVGCLLKKDYKGGHGHPKPPLATSLHFYALWVVRRGMDRPQNSNLSRRFESERNQPEMELKLWSNNFYFATNMQYKTTKNHILTELYALQHSFVSFQSLARF